MEYMGNTFLGAISDDFVFILFQLSLCSLAIFGLLRVNIARYKAGKGGTKLIIGRGEESMGNFYLVSGAGAILVNQIISLSTAYDGYKCFFSIMDLFILVYLCFFNPWWRNKIVELMSNLPKESYD